MASKKILIVEHQKDFALSLAAVLSEGNYNFSFVEKGKEAVGEATEIVPDLIILRSEMPDLSGYTICTRFRKNKKLKEIPIIFMSSEATEDAIERHRSGKHPASEYLIMPFDMDEFKAKIVSMLGAGEGEGEGEPAPAEEATSPKGEEPDSEETANVDEQPAADGDQPEQLAEAQDGETPAGDGVPREQAEPYVADVSD
jgi:DNA-binding response OmpR family regulator